MKHTSIADGNMEVGQHLGCVFEAFLGGINNYNNWADPQWEEPDENNSKTMWKETKKEKTG